MVANKITYFFDNKEVKEAFEGCFEAIWSELSTAQAFNLNEICKISDEEIDTEREFQDCEMLITNDTIKEAIEFFINEYRIDARSLFLNDEKIKTRLEEIINCIKNDPDDTVRDFSISFEKNSKYLTLFNILYSQRIKLEKREHRQDEYIDHLEFLDFKYQEFFDAINEIICEDDQVESFEFDHIGGDVDNKYEHLDIYYNFKLK